MCIYSYNNVSAYYTFLCFYKYLNTFFSDLKILRHTFKICKRGQLGNGYLMFILKKKLKEYTVFFYKDNKSEHTSKMYRNTNQFKETEESEIYVSFL